MGTPNRSDEYRTFINAYKIISRYAVDLSILEREHIQLPRPFEIGEDEFFEELYVKRNQESSIIDSLISSPNIVLLIGEKGAGKTSIGRNALRQFEKSTRLRTRVVNVDVRVEEFSAPISSLQPSQLDAELYEKLREKYIYSVFPFKRIDTPEKPQNTEIPFLKLIAFMIDPEQEKPGPFEFESISVEPRILYEQYKLNRNDPSFTYYDWLVATYITDKRVSDFLSDLAKSKVLRINFLIHAAQVIYKYERQCIWVDNVDNLSFDQQISVQSALKRMSSNFSQIANVVVAVRDRDVFKEYEFDEFQAPPYQTKVRLYTHEKDEVPAFELQKITFDEIRNIIRKRLLITFNRCNQLAPGQRSFQDGGTHDMALVTDSYSDTGSIYPIASISRETYEDIRILSKKIMDVWRIINAPYFANNSIRLLLDHHCDFLEYLLVNTIKRSEKASGVFSLTDIFKSFSIRGLTTEYLAWIRRSNIRNNVAGFYDIVKDKEAWLESGKELIGYTLEHLIITAIWNLTLMSPTNMSHIYRIPKVKYVLEKLELLGFERVNILQTMYLLYHEDSIRTHFIEIQPTDAVRIKGFEDIKDDYIVRVTPRGQCLLHHIINTFGYFFECVINNLKKQKEPIPSALIDTDYITVDEEIAIQLILPHLCQIAEMHISTLIKFRENVGSYQGRSWFTKYLLDFGIPLPPTYKIGRRVGGVQKALQLEMILSGILRYVRLDKSKDCLTQLQNKFIDMIDKISSYQEDEKNHISFEDITYC